MLPSTFLFIFHAGSRRLSSNSFRNSSHKEKTAGSDRVSSLMTMVILKSNDSLQQEVVQCN